VIPGSHVVGQDSQTWRSKEGQPAVSAQDGCWFRMVVHNRQRLAAKVRTSDACLTGTGLYTSLDQQRPLAALMRALRAAGSSPAAAPSASASASPAMVTPMTRLLQILATWGARQPQAKGGRVKWSAANGEGKSCKQTPDSTHLAE
jgi:hypothetical protein